MIGHHFLGNDKRLHLTTSSHKLKTLSFQVCLANQAHIEWKPWTRLSSLASQWMVFVPLLSS